jgi:hypothetical protein
MVEEIECLADAFEFLQEWPNNRRGLIFDTAFRACQRAYDGQVPISVAREAFAGFARSANPRGRLCSYALDGGTENRSRWRDGETDVAA